MKYIGKTATAILAAAALAVTSAGTAFASSPVPTISNQSSSQNLSKLSEADLAELTDSLKAVDPVAVRKTGSSIEKDYEFSQGSTLTVVEKTALPEGVASPALGAGQDSNGFYIDLSPADQRAVVNGGVAVIVLGLTLLLGPGAAKVIPIVTAFMLPYLTSLSCADKGKTMRFYYTLDGNATSAKCL